MCIELYVGLIMMNTVMYSKLDCVWALSWSCLNLCMTHWTAFDKSRGRGSSVTQRTASILAYRGKLDIQTEREPIRSSGKNVI